MAQKTSSDVARYASLSIVWGLIAGGAFLFLPWVITNFKTNATENGSQYAQSVFKTVQTNAQADLGKDPLSLILLILVLLIPVVIVATIVTGLITRIRLPTQSFARFHTALGFVGLAGTLAMFVPYILLNDTSQSRFERAALVIVVTGILARLQKPIQNRFQQAPAIISILLLAGAYGSIYLADQASLTTLVLTQLGLWITLASFGIIIYSGFNIQRHTRRANKGR